ncbi:hypothetical protein [Streptomyces sp. NPDC058086]|uniref:hypothetical protein n=1 Tax=Streptomyces sp. NPDC058086 TaxID=3346334 RepID=UPI0036DFE31B
MDTIHVAVDGWVDAIPAPGPRGTATFDLIVRAADADTAVTETPDTVVSCTSGAPQITHALLTDIQPGDLVRVSGSLVQPQAPGEAARLTVHCLEVLGTALIPVLNDMVLDRYGDYVVIFDADHNQVPVYAGLRPCTGSALAPLCSTRSPSPTWAWSPPPRSACCPPRDPADDSPQLHLGPAPRRRRGAAALAALGLVDGVIKVYDLVPGAFYGGRAGEFLAHVCVSGAAAHHERGGAPRCPTAPGRVPGRAPL